MSELSDRHEDGEYLIVDCGGGTLDCAVVSLKEKTFTVLASSGDNALGGYDFLWVMAGMVSENFPNARRDELLKACESAMDMRMPNDEILRIDLGDESCNLLVDEFTAACSDIHSRIEKTLFCLLQTLQKLPKKVILAGGGYSQSDFQPLDSSGVRQRGQLLEAQRCGIGDCGSRSSHHGRQQDPRYRDPRPKFGHRYPIPQT